MPKAPLLSRWWYFSDAEAPKLRFYLAKMSADCAQWTLSEDHTLASGYIFFGHPRRLPKKKIWLPGATFEMTTSAAIESKMSHLTLELYGSNPVIYPREAKALSIADKMTLWLKDNPRDTSNDDAPTPYGSPSRSSCDSFERDMLCGFTRGKTSTNLE